MNLLLVCRSWREIVISRPSLWSFIRVFCSDLQVQDTKTRILQALATWLQSSSSSLLQISVRKTIARLPKNSGLIEMLDIISAHSHRLEELTISATNMRPPSAAQPPVVFKYSPSIAAFMLSCQTTRSALVRSPNVLDLTAATVQAHSRLHSLILRANVAWRLPERGSFSLPLLVDLEMGIGPGQDMEDLYSLFQACPNLITIYLEVLLDTQVGTMFVPAEDAMQTKTRDAILLPALEQLIIMSGHLDAITPILKWLTCPALALLTAQGPSSFTPELLVSMRDMFVRSSPCSRMNVLILGAGGVAPTASPRRDALSEALESMLRVLSALEALSLRGLVVDKHLVQALTHPTNNENDEEGEGTAHYRFRGATCPNLRLLTMDCSEDEASELQLAVIEDMIETRWKMSARALTRVDIRITGVGAIEEESERLLAFKMEGLEVFRL